MTRMIDLLKVVMIIAAMSSDYSQRGIPPAITTTDFKTLEGCMEIKEHLDDVWPEDPVMRKYKFSVTCAVSFKG